MMLFFNLTEKVKKRLRIKVLQQNLWLVTQREKNNKNLNLWKIQKVCKNKKLNKNSK